MCLNAPIFLLQCYLHACFGGLFFPNHLRLFCVDHRHFFCNLWKKLSLFDPLRFALLYFQKLESRFPHGVYAMQAQLEIAYAYFKKSDPVSCVAAVDRF
ncbi:MAG: outer membrane protein assembly factor BamD, partial [Runella slithyformis]